MPLDFPSSPSNGDTYENYIYDSTAGVWKRISNPTGSLENLDDVDLTTPAIGDSLVYDGSGWVNGPRSNNAIINGDFGVWQRGTSFSSISNGDYNADRWHFGFNGSGATRTVTRETFTSGDIEAIGYGDAEYFLRVDQTVAGSGASNTYLGQRIEDARTFAGQEVTLSFWARSTSSAYANIRLLRVFGSGGSPFDFTSTVNINFTSSWARYSATFTVPSVSGKTIGAGSQVLLQFLLPINQVFDADIWGLQLEAGPVATPFRLAGGGSKAAELALCQRYYYVHVPQSAGAKPIGVGYYYSATQIETVINFPVSMRTGPSLETASGTDYYLQLVNGVGDGFNQYSITMTTPSTCLLYNNTDVSGTGGQSGRAQTNNTSAFIAFDAEL